MYYIYRIFFNNSNECYIGQTKNFNQRIKCHKYARKSKPNIRLYKFINNIGWDNVRFEIIETLETDLVLKSKERERFYINLLKPSLNVVLPLRDQKQYFKDCKQDIYFKRNIANLSRREENNKKSLEYYHKNKDKLKEKRDIYRKKIGPEKSQINKTKWGCPCGAVISFGSKSNHIKSKLHHKNLIKNINKNKSELIYSNKNIDIRL